MVVTLVIVTDERDSLRRAARRPGVSREHPARILVIIRRPGRTEPRLDAEVRFWRRGPGRDRGPAPARASSPTTRSRSLLPAAAARRPGRRLVAGEAPAVPAADPLGRLAQRRITDAAAAADPAEALRCRARRLPAGRHRPGLDPHHALAHRCSPPRSTSPTSAHVVSAEVAASRAARAPTCSPAGSDAAAVPVARTESDGPGITEVVPRPAPTRDRGHRPDGRRRRLTRPGQPEREVALHGPRHRRDAGRGAAPARPRRDLRRGPRGPRGRRGGPA